MRTEGRTGSSAGPAAFPLTEPPGPGDEATVAPDVVLPLLGASSAPADDLVPFSESDLPAADVEPSDGRAARSHRTRRAIIDAMRALHAEGDLRPTAPRVAERAGVSLRTVWQQFADMETLLVEASRRDQEILRSLVERIDPDQALPARISQFVRQRARVLEQMTPSWRAAYMHEPYSEQLRRNKARIIAQARAETETVFAHELSRLHGRKRQQLLDGMHAISIWSFWQSLRGELGLGPRQARELLGATLTALLAEAGFS
ncbi:MAG TPA: TetR/AcrR family transcriptional regulator [Streptosporangiaceae bacterium]